MTISPADIPAAARQAAGRRGRGRRAARRGFSLLELMLVLAVLVVIAALAMPAFFGPLENQRLRKSGERIRVEWTRARIHAMKSGQIQAFFYTPQGNQYWIEPLAQASDAMETSLDDPLGLERPRLSSADPLQEQSPLATAATLPDNVLFVSGGTLMDERDAAAMSENSSLGASSGRRGALSGGPLPADGSAAMTSVADPILFYPDGTSATARIVLGNTRNYFVVVELRGLTGIARSSDLLSAEELPP